MKYLSRKLRRKIKKIPSFELIALLTILQLVFPQAAKADTAYPTAPEIPRAVQEQALRLATVVPNLDLGQLPEIPSRPARRTIRLSVTAYSSTIDQTDGDPFTAASGKKVFDGMIAYNALPFGTHVRFPEYYGDKVFVVLDRMHASKGQYIADIWMETREQAKQWGVRVTTMEIL